MCVIIFIRVARARKISPDVSRSRVIYRYYTPRMRMDRVRKFRKKNIYIVELATRCFLAAASSGGLAYVWVRGRPYDRRVKYYRVRVHRDVNERVYTQYHHLLRSSRTEFAKDYNIHVYI